MCTFFLLFFVVSIAFLSVKIYSYIDFFLEFLFVEEFINVYLKGKTFNVI